MGGGKDGTARADPGDGRVDTHRDVHVAVALDRLGRRLEQIELATTRAGYERLLSWALSLGVVAVFGVEGTGCCGAGLARSLRARGVLVVEVMRPNRQTRRRRCKSDPTDAEAAARAVLSGEAAGAPKAGDDLVEMIRVLRVARSSAIKEAVDFFLDVDHELIALLRRMRSICVAAKCWVEPNRAPEVFEAAHIHLKLPRGERLD